MIVDLSWTPRGEGENEVAVVDRVGDDDEVPAVAPGRSRCPPPHALGLCCFTLTLHPADLQMVILELRTRYGRVPQPLHVVSWLLGVTERFVQTFSANRIITRPRRGSDVRCC